MTQGWCITGDVVSAPNQVTREAIFYETEPPITYHSNVADENYWGYAYTQFYNSYSFADGTYTISQCDQAACSLIPPTYDCVKGTCTQNTTGTGAYKNLAACLAGCAWYDCINGSCIQNTKYSTPGKYTSLSDCHAVCAASCPEGQVCCDPNNTSSSTCPSCPTCPTCPDNTCLPCPDCPASPTCPDNTCPPCPTCPSCPACPDNTCLPCPDCPEGQYYKRGSTGSAADDGYCVPIEDVNFTTISVPIFSKCDASGDPENDAVTISVIQGTEESELLKFFRLAKIEGIAACSPDVAAIPDGWLIRPEWHRPQVIYQFAEIDKSGKIIGAPKYKITVPHHVSDEPDDPLPNYKRGNWEIIYVLKDNSKVTIHSFDEQTGINLLNAIKLRIIDSYLEGAYLSKSSLVVTDTPIAEITVRNRMGKYYSTGTKNELPDWVTKW